MAAGIITVIRWEVAQGIAIRVMGADTLAGMEEAAMGAHMISTMAILIINNIMDRPQVPWVAVLAIPASGKREVMVVRLLGNGIGSQPPPIGAALGRQLPAAIRMVGRQ